MKGLLVSLLLTSLTQAVRVYLHPTPRVPPRLSSSQAGAVLSKHLDLERFEDATPYFGSQQLIFGQGETTGLLLTISDEDTKDIIPSSFKKTFSISSEVTHDSLSAIISTYNTRAQHVYSRVYEHQTPHPVMAGMSESLREFPSLSGFTESMNELLALHDFLEGDLPNDRFGAFDLTSMHKLRTLGTVLGSYEPLREIIANITARSDVKLAIVTIPSSAQGHKEHRRQSPQSPQPPKQSPLPLPHPAEPIDSISTCYTSAETCSNATSSCSGHGDCMQATKAGKTCFVCACSATKDGKGRKEHWAGNACERKDVSGPFVLLAGTAITLLLLVGGSVALLSGVGDEKLPSTLAGGVAHSSH